MGPQTLVLPRAQWGAKAGPDSSAETIEYLTISVQLVSMTIFDSVTHYSIIHYHCSKL